MKAKKFIALYRVSTSKQQDSQLGLKAQREAIGGYLRQVNGELICEVTEVESAGNKDRINTKNQLLSYQTMLDKRPQLKFAIEEAAKTGATIVVKEPSRLTRFSILMGFLIEYNVKFVCADCPNDDAMMLKLRTVFNEEENLRRSQKTREALAEKKKLGVKLGSKRGFTDKHRRKAIAANKKAASEATANIQAMDIICTQRAAGKTFEQIADKLNRLRYKTRKGNEFTKTAVFKLHQRCA